jgi:hypothetical protein
MTEEKKKITFAPGCFDDFEGTQEELDELIVEITKMFENGVDDNMLEEVDIEELMESDPDLAEQIFAKLDQANEDTPKRTLQ